MNKRGIRQPGQVQVMKEKQSKHNYRHIKSVEVEGWHAMDRSDRSLSVTGRIGTRWTGMARKGSTKETWTDITRTGRSYTGGLSKS
jgi:hypothetical protein